MTLVSVETSAKQVASSNAAGPSIPDAGAPRAHRLGVLRHKHYRNVWLASFGSSVGAWMEMMGIHWIVSRETGSAVTMAWLATAHLGPMVVLGLVGGLVADRVNRRTLFLVTQGGLMLVAAALAFFSFFDYFGLPIVRVLFAATLVNGILFAFNTPAWQVLTPRLVPRDELTRAIFLNGVQFNLARVVGPAIGGLLLAKFGAKWLFLINALSFIGVQMAVWKTPDSPAPPPTGVSAVRQIVEAVVFVWKNATARSLFLIMVVFSICAAPLVRLLPLLVQHVYHKGEPPSAALENQMEAEYGYLMAAMGLGAVAGVLILRFRRRAYEMPWFIPLSITGGGLSILTLAAMPRIWPACSAMFVCGIFWLWTYNACMAKLQHLVSDDMRGRVLAVSNTLVFGAFPLGTFAAGFIAELISGRSDDGVGTQVGMAILAAALTLMGVWLLSRRR